MKLFKRRNGKLKLSLRGKDAVAGILFTMPFIIGLCFLLLPMVVKSILFSFSNMDVTSSGYVLTKAAKNGLEHYIYALSIDPEFTLDLANAVKNMCLDVPLVLIFSFFAATLLNQKFKGRGIARSIFFFPVILTSGVVLGLESSDLLVKSMSNGNMMSSDEAANFLNMATFLMKYTSLPRSVVLYLSNAVNGIYDIVIASGVQILIFLAGLQSIAPSLYEASNIEGATTWENFWKITFPMISPLILVNSLYTIIDSFTSATNSMMKEIQTTIFGQVKYGLGSAMAWVYFLVIIVIISVVGKVISKRVFYYD